MKKCIFFLLFLNISIIGFSQVGINTTNPSDASVIDINSNSNGNYGGMLPPRVPTNTERDAIPADSGDVGMLVYVIDSGTLQIWNGISWEIIYTLTTVVNTLATQDFDTNISWNYTLTPTTYNVPADDDIWAVVASLGTDADPNMNFVANNFLGTRDLENPIVGNNVVHEIAFDNVNISSVINARVSFDYDVHEYDTGDDVFYEVFYDDVGQGLVQLVNGVGDLSVEGTVVLNIPNTVTNVRLTVGIQQNGNADYSGFDNFRVYGQ